MTDRLPPVELAALLRDFFRSMTAAIFEERGTLDKFIGDGVMAVFGAPLPQSDGAIRALRCAWRMLARVEETNRALPADRRFSIRIGVNTGRVMAGSFGSPDRAEFTVLGDAVRIAARLESMAAPGTIFVGRETAERASGAFSFDDLGRRVLRGRSAPVQVFQVSGPVGSV
jgi:adenylate cyclase